MNRVLSLLIFVFFIFAAGVAHAQYSPAPPPAPPPAAQPEPPQTCEIRLKDLLEEYLDAEDADLAKTLEQLDADDNDIESVGDAIEEEFDVTLSDADWDWIENRSGNEIASMLRSKKACD